MCTMLVRLASTLLPLHPHLQPPQGAVCLQAIRQLEEAQCKAASHTARSPPLALIVDGKALLILLAQPWRQQLLRVAMGCAVVVCCRVSPQQKAEVVECAPVLAVAISGRQLCYQDGPPVVWANQGVQQLLCTVHDVPTASA